MTEKTRIKAVFSDAGGILFDDSDIKNSLRDYFVEKNLSGKIGRRGGLERSIESGFSESSHSLLESLSESYREYKTKAQTIEGYSSENAYRDTFEAMGLGEEYESFIAWNKERPRIERLLNSGVKETIEKLKTKGIMFIVLTDATKHGKDLEGQLEKMGLEKGKYVTDIISSKDLGVKKPDKRFFDFALQKYGLKKEEVIFLGHDVDEIQGANSLGYSTVAYNYRAEDAQRLSCSQKICNFKDLIGLIDNRGK